MHINEMYEVQAKQLLHKLCDALGIEQQDRTKSGVEKAIRDFGFIVKEDNEHAEEDEEAEIERH